MSSINVVRCRHKNKILPFENTKKLLLENIIACNTIVVELFGVIPSGQKVLEKRVPKGSAHERRIMIPGMAMIFRK